MKALRLYAGPRALQHLRRHGLQPRDVAVIPAAAGGPKGLILGRLDRFLFGDWLRGSRHPIDLVGASIGAWRLATACLETPEAGFARLERDYIHQHYVPPPGRKKPSADQVSEAFAASLHAFFGGRAAEVLQHPRFRLHIVTARGRHLLGQEHGLRTPLGYLGAYLANGLHRRALGQWLERVVFSSQGAALPFDSRDFRTRQVALAANNFMPALQASCSIPFVLRAVHHIPGAPRGAYWDGGITDYHLHLDYHRPPGEPDGPGQGGLVLYPHFQQAIVPGWLDKSLSWRHKPTPFLDNMLVLAPAPEWIATLPNAKLPDRQDFLRYGLDLPARVRAWTTACDASQQLADEFEAWLRQPDPALVQPL